MSRGEGDGGQGDGEERCVKLLFCLGLPGYFWRVMDSALCLSTPSLYSGCGRNCLPVHHLLKPLLKEPFALQLPLFRHSLIRWNSQWKKEMSKEGLPESYECVTSHLMLSGINGRGCSHLYKSSQFDTLLIRTEDGRFDQD